jgi:hypothetical protein
LALDGFEALSRFMPAQFGQAGVEKILPHATAPLQVYNGGGFPPSSVHQESNSVHENNLAENVRK